MLSHQTHGSTIFTDGSSVLQIVGVIMASFKSHRHCSSSIEVYGYQQHVESFTMSQLSMKQSRSPFDFHKTASTFSFSNRMRHKNHRIFIMGVIINNKIQYRMIIEQTVSTPIILNTSPVKFIAVLGSVTSVLQAFYCIIVQNRPLT